MNFQHLKYFLTVAEELNITRAAERLYISQQSLSNHIANLERELDVKLFTRSPKLSLTYAGGLLVDTATEILDLHRQYLSKVGDINKQYVGALRVGISHTCGLALLPDVLPKFRLEFPQVEFSLSEGNSNQLEDELAHGRTDLIICFQPIIMEGVTTVPLTEQRLMMVVPRTFTGHLFGEQVEEVRKQFADFGDGEHRHHPGYGPGRGGGHHLPRALSPGPAHPHPGLRRSGPLPPHRPLHLRTAGGRLPGGPLSAQLRPAVRGADSGDVTEINGRTGLKT